MKTDSLNQLVSTTDTLSFIDRSRKKTEKELKKEKEEEEKRLQEGKAPVIKFLDIKTNLSSSWDIYRPIDLEFAEPLIDSVQNKIILQQKVDTIYKDIPLVLIIDSLNPRRMTIRNKWEYATEYKLTIDSASIHSLYGLFNNKMDQTFKVK